MPTAADPKPPADKSKTEKTETPAPAEETSPKITLNAVKGAVLEILGKPPGMKHCKVTALWDNRFRVNIYCESPPIPGTFMLPPVLTDSFFVYMRDDGTIGRSMPAIHKKYVTVQKALPAPAEVKQIPQAIVDAAPAEVAKTTEIPPATETQS